MPDLLKQGEKCFRQGVWLKDKMGGGYFTSQILTVPSRPALAMVLPSGAKTTPRTSFLWPLNVCKLSEFEVLHVLTKSSRPAEANWSESGEKLSESTPP